MRASNLGDGVAPYKPGDPWTSPEIERRALELFDSAPGITDWEKLKYLNRKKDGKEEIDPRIRCHHLRMEREKIDQERNELRKNSILDRQCPLFGHAKDTPSGHAAFSLPADWNLIDIDNDAEAASFCREVGMKWDNPPDFSVTLPIAKRISHDRLAEMLLTEGVAARQSTVPDGAVVEFSIGDFAGVEVSERRDFYFSWRDADGNARLICRVKVSQEKFKWEIITDGLDAIRNRFSVQDPMTRSYFELSVREQRSVQWISNFDEDEFSAIYFLSAAILRDFWVVENRENAFRLGAPRVRRHTGRDGKKIDKIIYLPRCKYNREKVTAAANPDTKIWSVSPHFIRSHFRVLGDGHSASAKQKAIATLHGITEFPSGKTWVRAHIAGKATDGGLVRYRSRTASRSLFDVIELSKQVMLLDGLNWFQFERLCEKLMEGRGYEIIDKVGDGGIDILAVNNSNGKFAIGQAKHWTAKVGPSVVREMIGTRSTFEAKHGIEPIALILSSSGFTSAATADAFAAGIELVAVGDQ